jgi:hypothetical protein
MKILLNQKHSNMPSHLLTSSTTLNLMAVRWNREQAA